MAFLKSSFDNQVGEYNVLVDGGAVGIYSTGIFIDDFSLISFMAFRPKVAFASAGGTATLSVGIRIPSGAVFPTSFAAAVIQPGALTWVGAASIVGPIEVIVAVAVEAMTAGNLIVSTTYFNTDK